MRPRHGDYTGIYNICLSLVYLCTSTPHLSYLNVFTMSSSIFWPQEFLPGTTDNYTSNEVIASGLTAEQVWPFLVNITKWETYYDNVSQITPPTSGPVLRQGDKFSFSTFGFPVLPSEVLESVAPTTTSPGRLAWRAWQEGPESIAINVYHAWIVEDLAWGVVRILTQESQIGKPAVELAATKPNPILNGHQNWLDGLVQAARDGL